MAANSRIVGFPCGVCGQPSYDVDRVTGIGSGHQCAACWRCFKWHPPSQSCPKEPQGIVSEAAIKND